MKTVSQELKRDHEDILTALDISEKISAKIRNNNHEANNDIKLIAEYMKKYVDDCHHEKEEHYLFPAIDEADESCEDFTDELEDEHHKAEKMISDLKDSADGDEIDKDKFLSSISDLSELLRHHIEEENTKLFPLTDKKFDESKQQELLKDFNELEEKEIGKGKHDEYRNMLYKLKEKYSS